MLLPYLRSCLSHLIDVWKSSKQIVKKFIKFTTQRFGLKSQLYVRFEWFMVHELSGSLEMLVFSNQTCDMQVGNLPFIRFGSVACVSGLQEVFTK